MPPKPSSTNIVGLTVLARLASQWGFSAIPLYLVAGLAFGNGGLAPLRLSGTFVRTGAEIGVLLLLFMLGLEYTGDELKESLRVGLPAGGTGAQNRRLSLAGPIQSFRLGSALGRVHLTCRSRPRRGLYPSRRRVRHGNPAVGFPHFNLAVLDACFQTWLRVNGGAINHMAVTNGKTRAVPRTLDQITVKLTFRERATEMGACLGKGVYLWAVPD